MTATNNIFSVETIVTKYRNYVDTHSERVAGYTTGVEEDYFADVEDSASDEHLMATLYNDVAGEQADKRVQKVLSKYASHYYKEALSSEEYDYLKSNFKEAVSYMFSHKRNSHYVIFPTESLTSDDSVYKFIESAQLKPNSNVFIFGSLAEVADLVSLLHDCNVYVGLDYSYRIDAWAFFQIRIFAQNKDVNMIRIGKNDNVLSSVNFDLVITEVTKYTPMMFSHFSSIRNRHSFRKYGYGTYWRVITQCVYNSLNKSGKMFVKTEKLSTLVGNDYREIKAQLFRDRSLASVTSIDKTSIMGKHFISYEIVVNKSGVDYVTMSNQIKGEQCNVLFNELDEEILLPSYYLAEKPNKGVPLSDLVEVSLPRQLETEERTKLRKGTMELPVISHLDLGDSYANANLQERQLKDYSYYWNMFDEIWDSNKNSFLLSSDIIEAPCVIAKAADYKLNIGYLKEGLQKEYGTTLNLIYLKTKPGIDVQYVAALLLSEEVSSVLLSIGNGSIDELLMSWLLNKILVPNRSELERYKYVAKANNEALKQLLDEQKQAQEHYMKAVRMRKHALTQSFSAMKAMFSALDFYRKQQNGVIINSDQISRVKKTTVEDAFVFLAENFDDMGSALERIADINYSFGKSEWIDPEQFIESYIAQNSNGWLNFKALTAWQHGDNQLKYEFRDPATNKIFLPKGTSVTMFFFPKNALEHILNNVVVNARSHGFVNKERNDYQILFSWRIEGDALVIEIANNGAPIPEEMGTDYILEYGTSTSLHQDGHNGIGCHEIDAIMREYDGRVRIVSNPKEDYTVKYVLTFNHINIKEINL